jgi:hypothetical protein
MKHIFLFITLIFTFNCSYSQNYKIVVINDSLGYNNLYLKLNDKIIKSEIHGFAFDIELLDYKVVDSNTVCLIYEAPAHFQYDKFHKSDGKWERSNTSGVLSGNNKWVSFKDPKLDWSPKTFKILKEDLVSIRKGDTEIIKDCNQFKTEREAWLKQVEFDYEQYLKSKKN